METRTTSCTGDTSANSVFSLPTRRAWLTACATFSRKSVIRLKETKPQPPFTAARTDPPSCVVVPTSSKSLPRYVMLVDCVSSMRIFHVVRCMLL